MITRNAFSRTALGAIMMASVLAAGITSQAPAQAQNRLRVIATHSILADVAAQVAGEAADVMSLIPRGANPHSYDASAQDVAALSNADIVIINGANFEENLLTVVHESAGEHIVVASECVPVRPVVSSTLASHDALEDDDHDADNDTAQHDSPVATACAANQQTVAAAFGVPALDEPHHAFLGPLYAIDCGGEHDDHADDAEDSGEHEHAEGSCDPHIWTDPANVGLWALTIRDALSAQDPANAEIYAENAVVYLERLVAASDEVQAMIETIPAERRYIITNHLAFNYFAARYGLNLVGVVIPGGSTSAEPSARDVLALIDTVNQYSVPAIFTDMTVSDNLARQVANESGAAIVSLYTGSLSGPDEGAGTYLDYLRYNANAIVEALR